jgi:hypothetical protein
MVTPADEDSFSPGGTVFPIVSFQVIIDGHCCVGARDSLVALVSITLPENIFF